jgi:hypothetical protein
LYTNQYWVACGSNQAKSCIQIVSDLNLPKTYIELGVVPKELCPAMA